MKKIALSLSIVALLALACKKDNSTYKVKYTVTGNTIEQYKISCGLVDNYVVVPITGTKDTIVYQPAGTVLKLDAKANSNGTHSLSGSIYVNDELAVTLTDADTDADGKTQVKIEYTLPK